MDQKFDVHAVQLQGIRADKKNKKKKLSIKALQRLHLTTLNLVFGENL